MTCLCGPFKSTHDMPSSKQTPKVDAAPARKKVNARLKFAQDLDILFEAAMKARNFTAALKAKELIGKTKGFFAPKTPTKPTSQNDKESETLNLEKLSVKALEQALLKIEQHIKR